jgi:hypothetical protein
MNLRFMIEGGNALSSLTHPGWDASWLIRLDSLSVAERFGLLAGGHTPKPIGEAIGVELVPVAA